MSYPRSLDEYSEMELALELARRERERSNHRCDYCGRDYRTAPCRFPERHEAAAP